MSKVFQLRYLKEGRPNTSCDSTHLQCHIPSANEAKIVLPLRIQADSRPNGMNVIFVQSICNPFFSPLDSGGFRYTDYFQQGL